MVGDRRKYLIALIGIELDTVSAWAARNGLSVTTYAALVAKPEVAGLIGSVVDEVNEELAQAETIKRFALLPKELDEDDGELTATMKIKRQAVEAEFASLIASLYAPTDEAVPA